MVEIVILIMNKYGKREGKGGESEEKEKRSDSEYTHKDIFNE